MSADVTLNVPSACASFVKTLKLPTFLGSELKQTKRRGQEDLASFFMTYDGLGAYTAAQELESYFLQLDKYNIPHSVKILGDSQDIVERYARLIGNIFLVKKFYDNEYVFPVSHLVALMETGGLKEAIKERASFLEVAPWETQSEHVTTWRTWYLIDPTGESCERIAREPCYCPRRIEQSENSVDGGT